MVRVLLVDDQEPYPARDDRGGGGDPGFEVVGRATSGEEALDLATTLLPDLVLMDVNLPGIDGLEATRRLRTRRPAPVVLLLSTYDEEAGESFVAESGAAAYVTKAAFGPDRLEAVWSRQPNLDARCGRPSIVIATDPPAASTRSRMSSRAMPPRSVPVTTSRSRSPSTDRTHDDRVRRGRGSPRRRRSTPPPRRAGEAPRRRPTPRPPGGPSPPALATSEASATGRPERASCAGNTPRVISRSASRAEFSETSSPASTLGVAGRRPVAGHGELVQLTRKRRQVRRHLPVDGAFEPTPLGVSRADQPPTGVGQVLGPTGEPLHLAGQLGRQPRTAEGQRRLLGEVGQQALLEGRRACPGGIVTSMPPRRSPRSTTGTSTPRAAR